MIIHPFPELARLFDLIHSGSWDQTAEAVRVFARTAAPSDAEELAEYRRRVNEALIAARAARANLKREIARVGAAQCFSSAYQTETAVLEQCTQVDMASRRV